VSSSSPWKATTFLKRTPNQIVYAAATSQGDEVQEVEILANEFAARVPELKIGPAAILSFLLERRNSPKEAIDDVEPTHLEVH